MSRTRVISLWILALLVLFGSAFASRWQFERHYERTEKSNQINQILSRSTLANLNPDDYVEYWQPVSFKGRFIGDAKLLRNRPLEGRNGFWVIDTFRTQSGKRLAVLVGWIPSKGSATEFVQPPQLDKEILNIEGIAREYESKEIANDLPVDQLLTLDSTAISSDFDYFVQALLISPSLKQEIVPIPTPRFSQGPHFFYAIQWIIFGIIAIVGSIYLTKSESSNVKT